MEYEKAKFKATCWNCSTEMKYDSSDIVEHGSDNKIICPVCLKKNRHKWSTNKIK